MLAKNPRFGGNPLVLISTPDVKQFEITPDLDFVIIGCKFYHNLADGVFDVFSTADLVSFCWKVLDDPNNEHLTIHEKAGLLVDAILIESMSRCSLDNLTVMFLGLPSLKTSLPNC